MKNRNQIQFHIMQKKETSFRVDKTLNLFFGLGGRVQVFIEDHLYELAAGGILAVSPERLHRVCCMDGSVIMLQIPPEVRKAAGEEGYCLYRCYVQDGEGLQPLFQRIRELYATLLYEYLQNHHRVSASVDGTLMQLVQYLLDQFSTRGDGTDGMDEKTAFIIRYIDTHWNEELTLSLLAKEVHFSVSYLSRFFQKTTGMNFSSYLRKVRMIHARRMLVEGDHSVTQIAYDCGFRSPSVFIEAFKQEYEMTPGQFRQEKEAGGQVQAGLVSLHDRDQRSDISVLLVHMPEKTEDEIKLRKELVELNCRETADPDHAWTRLLNIGYARDGLAAAVQEQMEKAQREIGFKYFRCHGILDDDMHIYSEDPEGKPQFSFSWVDQLFDFVTELGMKPFVELGFMPEKLAKAQTRIFDRPSVISGCRDMEKWKLLIRAVLHHLAERYGIDELRTWRFATVSLSYVRVGCLTLEDYAELYETTYQTVKEFDPELVFGGSGCFADLTDDEEIGLPWFLQFATERGCLPDFHSIQWYPCVQTDDSLFLEYTLNQHAAPALLSTDPDFLQKKLDELDQTFRKYHVEDRELFLEECSPTLWQRDLSCDTCYKAVWLAKNMAISAGRAVFGYWLLTDFMEERAQIQSVFHGGYGLFTYNGIPKAGYQAMRMISGLGSELVAEGDGYVLTRTQKTRLLPDDSMENAGIRHGRAEVNGRTSHARAEMIGRTSHTSAEVNGRTGCIKHDMLQLLVYNYSHFTDINCYRYKQLDDPAEAYSVFRPGEQLQLQFRLRDLEAGQYRIWRYALNRAQGSAFDQWLRMKAPAYPTREEILYLKKNSEPAGRMEVVDCRDTLLLDVTCMPLEMELICIEKI